MPTWAPDPAAQGCDIGAEARALLLQPCVSQCEIPGRYGKRAYVADPVGNNTLVVDIPSMKEVAKIAVGQVPKRNYTMIVRAAGSGGQ